MAKKKAIFNWSGGKDSAHALWRIMQSDDYEVVALLTTTNKQTGLSTMHNIPLELLQAQSERIGIPLEVVPLKPKGNLDDYTTAMTEAALKFKAEGINHFVYGDIFLHDVRSYREKLLSPLGIEVVEPLWGPSSDEIIQSYLASGLKTVVVTTMADGLGESAIGQTIDRAFIENLPPTCDPNGENGEYHTFCYDGPIFNSPVPFKLEKKEHHSFDIGTDDGHIKTYTYCFGILETEE